MDNRKILIDCDTGTDDAIAIVAALCAPQCDVVALTTVNGNVGVAHTSRNTLDLVHLMGLDVPVAVGAAAPLKTRLPEAHAPDGTHGATGLGNVTLPHTDAPFYGKNAVETIWEQAQRYGGQLEIVAVGPLTNLAVAFLFYPGLRGLVKHIWVMGGSTVGGNVNTAAEFNIWVDPEAARLVFGFGIPFTMVGLNVTERAVLDESDEARIRALGSPGAIVVADLLKFMFLRRDTGGEDAQMHDALALAAALCPECLGCEDYFVDVECEGSYTFGHTAVDMRRRSGRAPNASVAVELDLQRFRDWVYEAIKAGGPQ
jgi:pyrimidine-specific ribonucleoside hydrolase/non-specific riboncleoside hydrolase